MLAALCDCEVGGRNFDDALAKHFSELFRQRFDVDAESRAQPKAYIRLLQECERLKKLISANTQQIPLNIECFMDDKDVSGKMNRSAFGSFGSRDLMGSSIEWGPLSVQWGGAFRPMGWRFPSNEVALSVQWGGTFRPMGRRFPSHGARLCHELVRSA